MRRGGEPRAGVLLPPQPPLRGTAHRGRMGLSARRPARLRARLLGCARGCQASETGPRHRRGCYRAGAGSSATATRAERYAHLRLRCWLRSGETPTWGGWVARAGAGAVAFQPSLLRRPRTFLPAAGGPSAPPRQEVRPQGFRELAGAYSRASLRQRRLRDGARQVLVRVAPQDPADRRALRVRKVARRAR